MLFGRKCIVPWGDDLLALRPRGLANRALFFVRDHCFSYGLCAYLRPPVEVFHDHTRANHRCVPHPHDCRCSGEQAMGDDAQDALVARVLPRIDRTDQSRRRLIDRLRQCILVGSRARAVRHLCSGSLSGRQIREFRPGCGRVCDRRDHRTPLAGTKGRSLSARRPISTA